MSPRIDAHLHLWRLARGDYGWITEDLRPLRRDFEPEDAVLELQPAGIDGAVLVQAAPTVEETRFLLGHARAHPWVQGVVGWVDLGAPAAPAELESLARDPWLKGIRPMIQDIPDPAWMLGPALAPALHAVKELDLTFDALVTPRHLDPLIVFLDRYPDLRLVIDHGAKPAIGEDRFEPWASRMREIARASRASCKLSGLITEAGPDWSVERLRPYVDHLLEVFGPGRLIFGSDWPVLTLAGDYRGWLAALDRLLAGVDPDDRTRIFGTNAARAYRLAEPAGGSSMTPGRG